MLWFRAAACHHLGVGTILSPDHLQKVPGFSAYGTFVQSVRTLFHRGHAAKSSHTDSVEYLRRV
jgi:hypothetical protein